MVKSSSQELYNPQNLPSLVIDEKSLVEPTKDDRMTENILKDSNNDIKQKTSQKMEISQA